MTRLAVLAALIAAVSTPAAAVDLLGHLTYSKLAMPGGKPCRAPFEATQDSDWQFEVWFVDHGGCDDARDLAMDLVRRTAREHGLCESFDHVEVFCQAMAGHGLAMAISVAGDPAQLPQMVSARCYRVLAAGSAEDALYLGLAGGVSYGGYDFVFAGRSDSVRYGITIETGRDDSQALAFTDFGVQPSRACFPLHASSGTSIGVFTSRSEAGLCLFALIEQPAAPGHAELRVARICDTAEYLPLGEEDGHRVVEEYVPTTGPGSTKAVLEGSKAFTLYQSLMKELNGRELTLDLPHALVEARRALEEKASEQPASSCAPQ
jgi:hypothetical protein